MSGDDPLNPENLPEMIQRMLNQMGMDADAFGDPEQFLQQMRGLLDQLGIDDADLNDPQKLLEKLGSTGGFPGATGGTSPALSWPNAQRMAEAIASKGGAEANLDPSLRLAVEDLARVADLHARQRPGVHLPSDVTIRPVSRRTWTTDAFAAYRPFFERFGQAVEENGLTALIPTDEMEDPEALAQAREITGAFEGMVAQFIPYVTVSAAATMIGHLGHRVIGTYDLPVPRPGNDVQVVPVGMQEIADAVGAPVAEVQMYVLIHELIAHSVLSVPHVSQHLEALYLDFASAFRADGAVLEEQLGELSDMEQLTSLGSRMSEPGFMLDLLHSRTHDLLMPQLDALVAAVLGFVEHSTMTACAALMTGHPAIRDALRRRRAERQEGEVFMEKLLGLKVNDTTLDRGAAFIAGIVERVGDVGLERLWADELDLPTAAEVDAPGLWLERIGLGDDASPAFEIPDDISGLD